MTPDQWRWAGFGVVVALALGAVLYFGGRWQERSYASSDRAELAAAEDRIRLLRARSLLFESAADLDRRNFGVANEHLQTAAAELGAVREGGPGMDLQALAALRRDIAETDLNVATNLEVQRAQVLGFLARLDTLMPDERPSPATAGQPEQ